MAFSCIRCIFKLILSLAIIVGLILAAIFIGAAVQKGKAKKATDITPQYTNGHVCAYLPSNNSSNTSFAFTTYNSVSAANSSNATIGQCGDCGQCSNLQDYKALVKANSTFYENVGYCGLRAAAGSSYVNSCVKGRFDFTSGCNSCLTSFVMCGFKQCGFTCVATAILKEAWISSSNTTNDCLYCTDQLCGLSLLTCAGANQQRLNVKSNINIPKAQYCNATTVDWTSYKF